jgi:hypothetical protein
MFGIKLKMTGFVDDTQPGRVGCESVDASGQTVFELPIGAVLEL